MNMLPANHEAHCAWQTHAKLGEGPLWVAAENMMYWVDILGAKIFRYHPVHARAEACAMPFAITSLASTADGRLLCTGPQSICLLDTRSGNFSEVLKLPADTQGIRINDGCCHPSGDFWFGTMDLLESAPHGDFYRLGADANCTCIPAGFVITNGPAFSPDGKTGYFVDTLARQILHAPMIDGAIAQPLSPFVRIAESNGYPDGLAVDADGGVWCSHWAGGRVTRFDAKGRITDVVRLPVSNVTKCAFGGEHLDRLFITTARKGLSTESLLTQPLAGSLFEVGVKYRGVLPAVYRDALPVGATLGSCFFETI